MAWTRRRVAAVAGVGFAVAAVGAPVAVVHEITERNAVRAAALADQIEAEAREDGFEARVPDYMISGRRAVGSLAIGPNCTLHGVTLHLNRSGWQATDVTGYSFDAILNPSVTHEFNAGRRRHEDVLRGPAATFMFTDREDLETNVLGEQPCEVLAANLALQQSVDRVVTG
jgi:hypothetical protein